ncbi:unnamed protein product [Rhizoctonia solani]|uniref:Uncharacterized protein n=1 Tax=Rhizoctonia solani TaxID=456999 RepID=A0A8H2X8P2_9AGAM|nr:unnamed protein product [Rhizoctonia solani]
MSVDLEALELRAWVVDSKGRPLPFFNLRRIAPEVIETWIIAVSGERFAIYFNGRNQSPEQEVLDIHAVAEFDGLRKLDGVILPSTQRAQGYVGGMLDQPARKGKSRPLKWGRLRLIDDDENSNDSEHMNTIEVTLQWGRFNELRILDKFTKPENRRTAHERAVKNGNSTSTILGGKVDSPVARLCRFEQDNRFKHQTFVFRYASQEWLKNHTRFLLPSEPRSTINTSPARECLEQHPQCEGLRVQCHDEGPRVVQIKLDPDASVEAVSDLFNKKSSGEKRYSKRKYQPHPVVCSKIKLEDSKSVMPQSTHATQTSGNTPNEPIVISSESETEESSDDDIQLIKQVIFYKNEKKKKKHAGISEEGGVKKRLKSEEYVEPMVGAGAPGSGWDNKNNIVNIKIEPTD